MKKLLIASLIVSIFGVAQAKYFEDTPFAYHFYLDIDNSIVEKYQQKLSQFDEVDEVDGISVYSLTAKDLAQICEPKLDEFIDKIQLQGYHGEYDNQEEIENFLKCD
jgi:hypothetical protein